MGKFYDVVAIGELLIDFTVSGESAGGQKLFERNPGGAPANMLTAASHFGFKTAFIGKVGDDMHGRFLKETLDRENIDTSALVMDDRYFTTLAFVDIADGGERIFSFARKPGADTMLEKSELPVEMLKNTKVLHFGSLSLVADPARESTYEAVKTARAAGALISYDPNYRASLWSSEEIAVREMGAMMEYADLVKVSDEEVALLTGSTDPKKGAEILLAKGPKVVAVTLGKDGALIATKEGSRVVAPFAVKAVDTTGAGDSFWGGFMSAFLTSGKDLSDVTLDELASFAKNGNATAALCVGKRGGIPAIPTREEVEALMK